ncbi:MAG: type II secretion system protein E [Alphaproteobacteria bacterium]|nr:MAG: type II secretion system protein E [Alphaproteobacteria bacterium]
MNPENNTASVFYSPEYIELKVMLHGRLLDMINLAAMDKMPKEILKAEVAEIIRDLLIEEKKVLNSDERNQLIKDIQDELLGLGPLEPLLKDHTVTDILVNGYKQVFVERKGLLEKTQVRFKDDRHLTRIINKIVAKVGRRVDESMPMVDARLEDGSRVNAIIPPLAVDGALLSIRKFSKIPIDMDKLVELNTIPADVVILLQNVVRSRRNIVISGGTGSGKTTLLNAMSAAIDERERIITIEDSAELQLQQEHVGRLETRPENIENKGEVTQRDLVKNALRMRPDRIIIGEVRGGEAFDMLQAMNTGHEGSMTTVHANSCRDAMSRIEQMVCMNNMDISQTSVRSQIASAINVIIQVQRLADGRRRLMTLSEITGMEADIITIQDIFRYKRQSIDSQGNVIGHLVATGIRPRFVEEFAARGLTYPQDIFDPNRVFRHVDEKGS